GDPVVLHLRVDETYRKLIRKDAVASLATQGIIGMKVVEIDPGTEKSARVEDGDAINSQAPIELSQVLSDAYDTGQELRAMGRKLDGMLTRMDEITAQVQEGKGTLGQLVMTDDAHRAAMELMQSGDQMVTTLDESMIAVRRVWPLRDYFIGQGMTNPDELLFRPNATRQVRTYASSKLFEPGRSVITAEGKRMLDATAAWLKGITDQDSEIVIAAFDSEQDNDLRDHRLTQEQANAARDYLVNIHTVNKLGFFARRKVVAAGFGRGENELDAENNLSRSVTVVVFIPDQ
ncbi:MAG: OmpA family protein, partial [Planctomycetales bacterium]